MSLRNYLKRSAQRSAQRSYRRLIKGIPQPGNGLGFHHYQMRIAHAGKRAGYEQERILADIRQSVNGDREVLDQEIEQAIETVFSNDNFRTDCSLSKNFKTVNRNRPARLLEKDTPEQKRARLDKFLNGNYISPIKARELSPIKPPQLILEHVSIFLRTLFKPNDLIYIGERNWKGQVGLNILTCEEWIKDITSGEEEIPSLLTANPFSKYGGVSKSGDHSFRSDNAISDHRFSIVEFDSVPTDKQLGFFFKSNLPIVAIVFSGSKSYHAWVDVRQDLESVSASDWSIYVSKTLKPFVVKYGADPTTFNPSRLTRMPGHFRAESKKFQRFVYLKSN